MLKCYVCILYEIMATSNEHENSQVNLKRKQNNKKKESLAVVW